MYEHYLVKIENAKTEQSLNKTVWRAAKNRTLTEAEYLRLCSAAFEHLKQIIK